MTGPAPRPAKGAGADLTVDLALAALAALLATAAVLWISVTLATLASTGHAPRGGTLADALKLLVDPGRPGRSYPPAAGVPGPFLVWPIALAVLALLGGAVWSGRWAWARFGPGPSRQQLPGTASVDEVDRLMGRRALLRKASFIRPSVERPAPREVGLFLGRAHGRELWGSLEDSYLVVAPPRAGKGVHVVIPAILDAPGAVLAPSTKPDNLITTLRRREQLGPVAVFDPQGLAGLPGGLRWSPVRGCADPLTAILRARALVEAAKVGRNVTDGDYWEGMANAVVRALLHAAALDGRDAHSLLAWVQAPANQEPVRILRAHTGAAAGWADELESQSGAHPHQRESVWGAVRRSFDALADPRVLDAVTPAKGREEFDPHAFIRDRGTLYLLGTADSQLSVAPIVTALIEDITEVARRLAARAEHGRLDPPLLLALDEAANIAPLPSLPSLLADGGGVGLPTICVLQSLAQARARWGEQPSYAMWDSATVKIILGGLAIARDLEDLSRLAGDRDEPTLTWSTNADGGRTSSTAMRRVAILPVDAIRNLDFGTGIVLHRTARPAISTLTPWWKRRDHDQLTADVRHLRGVLARDAFVPADP